MFYEYVINVIAGTKSTQPIEVDALVDPGILTRVEVDFPDGCNNEVYIALIEGTYQIVPRNPEQALKANDYVIPITEYYPLTRGHNQLNIRGWSPLAAADHEIIVRLTVEVEEIASPLLVLKDFVDVIKKLIGL
jgi:hypothetical protein